MYSRCPNCLLVKIYVVKTTKKSTYWAFLRFRDNRKIQILNFNNWSKHRLKRYIRWRDRLYLVQKLFLGLPACVCDLDTECMPSFISCMFVISFLRALRRSLIDVNQESNAIPTFGCIVVNPSRSIRPIRDSTCRKNWFLLTKKNWLNLSVPIRDEGKKIT